MRLRQQMQTSWVTTGEMMIMFKVGELPCNHVGPDAIRMKVVSEREPFQGALQLPLAREKG
jgi:hypothetical protein